MPTDTQPEYSTSPAQQDRMRAVAERISKGDGGRSYIYCSDESRFFTYADGYWKGITDNTFDTGILGNLGKNSFTKMKNVISDKNQTLINPRTRARP